MGVTVSPDWNTLRNKPTTVENPGTVAYFAASAAPSGWLAANGSAVSRTTYAALFAVIGTTYGVGDGVTTFNLPELRGEFIRSLDSGRGVDIGRSIGTLQAQDIQSHTHGTNGVTANSWQSGSGPAALSATATNTGAAGGTETRPRNVALLACIKF